MFDIEGHTKKALELFIVEIARRGEAGQLQLAVAPPGLPRAVVRLIGMPADRDQPAHPNAHIGNPGHFDRFCLEFGQAVFEVAASRGGKIRSLWYQLPGSRVRVVVAPEQMEHVVMSNTGAAATRALLAGHAHPPKPVSPERPTRAPDVRGAFGSAWLFAPYVACDDPDAKPDFAANLQNWLLECPQAHPMWSHWLVSLIHLRDIEGVPPAKVHREGATHEFVIAALEPGQPLPDVEHPLSPMPKMMQPVDVVHQVVGVDDEQAVRVLFDVVKATVHGYLSPDADWREVWKTVLDGTAKHYAEGHHGVN